MRSHMFPKPSESVRVRLSGNVAYRHVSVHLVRAKKLNRGPTRLVDTAASWLTAGPVTG